MKRSSTQRAQLADRIAHVLITLGGVLIIVGVVGILLLIAREAVPLFLAPESEHISSFVAEGEANPALAVGMDEYAETGFLLYADGRVQIHKLENGSLVRRMALSPQGESALTKVMSNDDGRLTCLWANGVVTIEEVAFAPEFSAEGERSIVCRVERVAEFASTSTVEVVDAVTALDPEAGASAVVRYADGTSMLFRETREEDLFGNVTTDMTSTTLPLPGHVDVSHMVMSPEGRWLYLAISSGDLLELRLDRRFSSESVARTSLSSDGSAVTALSFVLGGESLAVGTEDGDYSIWSRTPVERGANQRTLSRIHSLKSNQGALVSVQPSRRNKSLLGVTSAGGLRLDHMTSERNLVNLSLPNPVRLASLSRRGDGLIAVDSNEQVHIWLVDNPHPEASARTLFGKVWYEGYPEPDYTWQSSSASDDAEPKLSLIPLIFGSLKGTLYAMLLAVPLALFGALYTSQLTTPAVRNIVKPTVEIMAAIPSVVVGFLAALWFAPLVERNLSGYLLAVILLPACFMVALLMWQALRRIPWLRRAEEGYEFLAAMPILVLSGCLIYSISPWFEQVVFDGNVQQWLYDVVGVRYDPRNCVIIAFALGFAVIPIIFTIAEDSFSNVPRSLTAGSLALGASRWQTVWRVVLPSASPGIFAGTMIGFGRAVGETMIVLMATGNTPIMDWGPFNGMRTLSANIAVEIPEAPHGGTLYRILFLSAVVLFVMTFLLNTVAELVRQRLREKYGQFQ